MPSNPESPNPSPPLVELFTDGSCCHGNPGPGGWAFILRHSKSKIERVVSGGIGFTSTERMEMIAIINGLRSLKRPCRVTVFTDCKSVVDGIARHVTEWKQFGWRKSVNSKKYVNNADLWMHLAKQCAKHVVAAKWVKGHAGHPENERCDKLARGEARKAIENLENSAQKDGAGADAMLADWVSAAVPPAARPAASAKPASKRTDDAEAGGRRKPVPAVAPDRAPATRGKPAAVAVVAAPRQRESAKTMALFPQPITPAPAAVPVVEGPIVDLFTDGACIGNPGPGGWAFVLRHRATRAEKASSGGAARTTNNRMEVMAVIKGLGALSRPCKVNVYTDSQYVAKGINEWSSAWKKFGWRKTVNAKAQVMNADLWAKLDEAGFKHTIVAQWVRGHAGHPENKRCDQMAQRAAEAVIKIVGAAPADAIKEQ